MKSLLC